MLASMVRATATGWGSSGETQRAAMASRMRGLSGMWKGLGWGTPDEPDRRLAAMATRTCRSGGRGAGGGGESGDGGENIGKGC